MLSFTKKLFFYSILIILSFLAHVYFYDHTIYKVVLMYALGGIFFKDKYATRIVQRHQLSVQLI